MSITKNIRNYYIYSTFAELLILGPIFMLFFVAKGLSYTQIMTLNSVAAVSVVLFEVPTGAIADKIGRKFSMCLGAIFWVISLLVYILGTNFFIFMIAEVIFSIGATLKSGADTALIYDSLKSKNNEHRFQKIEGTARSLSLCAQAIGSIIASYIYEININLPMIVSIGFMIITVIVALRFDEPSIKKENDDTIQYFKQIKDSGKYIFNHEKIKAILAFSMVFYIFYRAGFLYFQPYMKAVDIPVKTFGVVFFIFNITAALVSKISDRIMSKTKPKTLTFMAALLIVSFILLGLVKVEVGVIFILLQQIARGLYRPVTRKYLNKHIPSDKRATILSFQNLATSLASAIFYPLIGILLDNTNIFTSHLVLAGAMIVMMFFATRYMDKRLGVDFKEESRKKKFKTENKE